MHPPQDELSFAGLRPCPEMMPVGAADVRPRRRVRSGAVGRGGTRRAKRLSEWGYNVSTSLNGKTLGEVRRFLDDWGNKMDAGFLMVSLPPDFKFPDATDATTLIEKAVLSAIEPF